MVGAPPAEPRGVIPGDRIAGTRRRLGTDGLGEPRGVPAPPGDYHAERSTPRPRDLRRRLLAMSPASATIHRPANADPSDRVRTRFRSETRVMTLAQRRDGLLEPSRRLDMKSTHPRFHARRSPSPKKRMDSYLCVRQYFLVR